MDGPKTGFEGKLYIDPQGAGESSWQECALVGDINPTDEKVVAQLNDRQKRVISSVTGRHTMGHEFQLTFKREDARYQALRDAFYATAPADKIVGVAVMDDAITNAGAEGWQYDAEVTQFARAEPIDGLMVVNVRLTPAANSSFAPAYVVVEGSS